MFDPAAELKLRAQRRLDAAVRGADGGPAVRKDDLVVVLRQSRGRRFRVETPLRRLRLGSCLRRLLTGVRHFRLCGRCLGLALGGFPLQLLQLLLQSADLLFDRIHPSGGLSRYGGDTHGCDCQGQ
jgi:hypothetical protein